MLFKRGYIYNCKIVMGTYIYHKWGEDVFLKAFRHELAHLYHHLTCRLATVSPVSDHDDTFYIICEQFGGFMGEKLSVEEIT